MMNRQVCTGLVHICNPATGKTEAEEEKQVQGKLGLHSKTLSSTTSVKMMMTDDDAGADILRIFKW